MVRGLREESQMTGKRQIKLVQEGDYLAQLEVELLESPEGWSPYLSLEDAKKLDLVRQALRSGDLKAASAIGRVFKLMRVAAY